MRILVYSGNPKMYWIVNTPAQMDGAKRSLFEMLLYKQYYIDIPPGFYETFKRAKGGDIRAIDAILKMRNGRPNETWTTEVAHIKEDKTERYKPGHLLTVIRELLGKKP